MSSAINFTNWSKKEIELDVYETDEYKYNAQWNKKNITEIFIKIICIKPNVFCNKPWVQMV